MLTVFSWRLFRIGLALLCLFHVGVWVVAGISFGWNVLAYGAFVAWRRVPALDRAGPVGVPVAAAKALTTWAFANLVVGLEQTITIVLLVAGLSTASWYAAWLLGRGRSRRPAGRHTVSA